MGSRIFTGPQLTEIVSLLGQHASLASAIPAIQQIHPQITKARLEKIFERAELATPASYLKSDPVVRQAIARSESLLTREHRQLTAEVERLREAIDAMSALASAPLPPIKRRERASGLREGTAVALASDWHVEERIKLGDTPARNLYNLKVASKRVDRFFDAFVALIEKERNAFLIRDAVLWFGGDLMSGHIHPENVETSAMTPIATMLWLYPQLITGVAHVLEHAQLESLSIVCSYGNHGRDTQKPRRATGAHHSYEWGMYQVLAQHFKGHKIVKVLADPSAHQYMSVYDFDLHFHHGDEVVYHGGVGGITIPINKAVAQWDRLRRCHYHNFGHFHQYIDTGNVCVNGSLIGYNAYAMSIKASPEPPQQAFYVIDSKRGKTAKSPLWVAE